MQRIADADTPRKKRSVELHVMITRKSCEMSLHKPIDDEYGVDRINAMIADIKAEYAAKMGIAGVATVDEQDGDISEGF
jgi:hypothetical protein